jgi:hypothetical protein
MRYQSKLRAVTQTEFGGLTRAASAKDGDIYDMRNLTGSLAPVLASRPPRTLFAALSKPNGIFAKDGLIWADGTDLVYKGESVGTVSDSPKTFGELGAYVVILPDKKYLNILTGEFGDIEKSVTSGTYWIQFTNGTYKGETAEANTLYCEYIDFSELFRPLDAVTISGCTVHPENNKTVIVREVSEDGHSLRFYEYTFTLDGEEGTTPYFEPGTLTVARTMPDLDFICSNENRLWGAKGDEIFGSALGDPFNWNVFDVSDSLGTVADSSYNAIVGSGEDFSAMFSYMGYPVAVKPSTGVYKVFGTEPDNFQISGSASAGVAYGSARSVAVAGEICFWLSDSGIMAYTGGIPSPRYENFGEERFSNGVAGSDTRRYYISMRDARGDWALFVYDTLTRMWHREDDTRAVGFAFDGGALYMLTDSGKIWIVSGGADAEGTTDAPVPWMCEFADIAEDEYAKKGVTKFYARVELDEGASCEVRVRYDSEGEWQKINEYSATAKRSFTVPVIPRRADHYRVMFTGAGGFRMYSLTREFYSGSPMRSVKGRQ